ncbi:MAG: metal ABC transporter ATP-binding protein [Solirubrobacterales bacterium]
MSVTAEGLTVAFGAHTALEDVSFDVPAGSSVAVLGPNGAGKSTLFAAAVGLAEVTAGEIDTGDAKIALVPQRLELTPGFPVTVADVVRMGRYGELGLFRRFGRRDRELVDEALSALSIEHLSRRRFGDLSGGERQRALLAQAAAQDPELLLLDEPFTGVDAPTGEAVRELLGRWREQGRTTFVATHDLRSASRDHDLVLCLNRKVIAFGPPAETINEEVLAETFAGRVLRVGELMVDIAHHHHGAG